MRAEWVMSVETRARAWERLRRLRGRLRAQGLRPVTRWVPDTRAPGFAAEAARQAALIDADSDTEAAMRWIEETGAWPDDGSSSFGDPSR